MKVLAPQHVPIEKHLPAPKVNRVRKESFAQKKVRGVYRWVMLARRKRNHDPLCEVCLSKGIVTAATEVHHLNPVITHPEKAFDWDNLQSICHSCHQEVTGFQFYDE